MPNAKQLTVHYSLDGRPQETTDVHQTAAEILRNGDLDSNLYDLTEKRPGNTQPKHFKDDQPVHIKEGDVFLSLRVRGEVA
jgi:hypothetical protein